MSRFHVVVLAATLVGCGSFAPTTGTWMTGNPTVVSNTCSTGGDTGGDTGGPQAETFNITDNGDGTFTITSASSDTGSMDLTLTCTLDGKSFTCTPFTQDNPVGYGMDATITIAITATGDFSDESTMSMTQTMDMTCAGADCGTIETMGNLTLPCQAVATADATLQ